MYICKYMNVTRDSQGQPLWECPFIKRVAIENALIGKNILMPCCPEDIKRDANSSPICFEINVDY